MSMLSSEAIARMGFASVGTNVLISSLASFHNSARISIGNNVRVDDFCVLSAGNGGIEIGNYVHIAVYSSLIGASKIVVSDFCNLSSRVSVYSSSDDYSGEAMTNPMIPSDYKNVTNASVFLGRHVIVGAGAVILPGANLREGVAIGALSLVENDCEAFSIYAGIPAKFIRNRGRRLLELERAFLASRLA